MQQKYNGFVLIVVLVFLQLFTLLSLFAFQSVSLSLKSQRQAWERQKQLWHEKYVMHKYE